jgi:cysteine desulfurase family protein (TIGR01976 family)
MGFDVQAVRSRFSSLAGDFAFFDAPGGSQVPDEVGRAIATTMAEASGNLGAPYTTGHRIEELFADARARAARFMGCDVPEIVFGMNMTTLNFTLSRTLGRDLHPGDEIVITRLDHDGNVAPWLELAEDRGLVIKMADVVLPDCSLDFDDLERLLSDRTRVVSFPWASNAVGTIVDARRVSELAHSVGALAWVDAVQYAPHQPIDVRAIEADVVMCSPYKFCGPHLGIAYGRASVIERWRPYKARPSATEPLGRRFETGTQPYELLAGFVAALDYLDDIGGMDAIVAWERELGGRFLAGLPSSATLYGMPAMAGRVPTFLVNLDGVPAPIAATELARRGFGVWSHDNYYSLGLYPRLGYDEALRIGLAHYNTLDEVDRLCGELRALTAAAS